MLEDARLEFETLLSFFPPFYHFLVPFFRFDLYKSFPILPFSFIRLADYLIVNTMHVLAFNSVATLLNYFVEQLKETPDLDLIRKQSEENLAGNENKVLFITF